MDTFRLSVTPERQSAPRVLLVGHPTALAAGAAMAVKSVGMDVEIAATMTEAIYLLTRFHPAVVLLYAEDADPDGMDRIPPLAQGGDSGVILVLAEDSDAARIAGLDAGADDVVGPNTPPRELVARTRAVHRRVTRGQTTLLPEPPPQVGIDPAHRCLVGRQGERTALSEAEFIALETLLDADGAPVSREWLGRLALKRLPHPEDRSVDQLVLKLRRKLASVGASERTILSARRQGYVIADPARFRSVAPVAVARDRNVTMARIGG